MPLAIKTSELPEPTFRTALISPAISLGHLGHRVLFFILLLLVFSLSACTSPPEKADRERLKSTENGFVKQPKIISNGKEHGIQVLAVRLTAKGYLLDFRFRLTDLEKSKHIMQRKIKAQLLVEKSNSVSFVPVSYKLGALRQSGKNLKTNKNYFMFFANPNGHVKEGDLVTILIDDFKAEHIIVN